ncbi:N-acetylglucosamine-1-phosphotransferase subunits alpha/beta-like isoform X1 [Dunckerocampus dactyliophorus]|uniref:N-acetylglucosamine-1-phosphotransferase subunits alpha/beta-like isoform X1 n=2 Tax=Dunckerocampus dactyliophorus TaxID=161453 RepID=UPI002405DCCC|nr:N-acetylglucosamine-1-phosphotransferase subunits alpha/beta-like isoform X1 [Dunckerocampus dactyliophorus]
MRVFTALRRKFHTRLSQRYRCHVYCMALILVIVTIYQTGEIVDKRSRDRSFQLHEMFEPHQNYENCTSFHSRECTPMPIDLVYTWVNGSDVTLLRGLAVAKVQLEEELGEKPKCPLAHCFPAPVLVLDPALPASMTVNELPLLSPSLSAAKELLQLNKPLQPVSAVIFHSQADADKALAGVLKEDQTFSVSRSYLTTDKEPPGLIQMQTLAYLSGFPASFRVLEELRAKLPTAITDKITTCELYPEASIALLHLKSPQHLTDLLQEANNKLTLDGKELAISPVYLFYDIIKPDFTKKETKNILKANRFEDNDALRHSLRSVEKYAPWVRHIFIVTNGQIPFWLNLENPRVSVVTHQEIFLNHNHLPTFSSPAIESNLHRIPGISQKFIYLNDDVMFGKDVWVDDFYTPSNGQKVYLTWRVGPCSKGCRGALISNGYCDQACNNNDCEWDGGDCKAEKRRSVRSVGIQRASTTIGGHLPQAIISQAAIQKLSLTTASPFLNEDKSVPKAGLSVAAKKPMERKLQQHVPSNKGFLPWQKMEYLEDLLKEYEHLHRVLMYETNGAATGRKLQDSFGASLSYVDRLYNRKFGVMPRKVIAHTPHMIDKFIMQELQDTFPKEFEKTSSHRLRHTDDMQFAFSYFYFMMSVKQQADISEVFDTADKDQSGVLSDSEVEALATRIYKQPLKPRDFTSLVNELITCSEMLPNEVMQNHQVTSRQEVYHDQNMPQITKYLILNCKPVTDHIRRAFADKKKYKYQIMGEQEIHFKLIKNDKSMNILHFKDIQNNAKKFICLNDDIDHSKSNANEVKAMLAEFYKAMFPQPSQFELPKDKTNRFLHMDDLQKWHAYQEKWRFYRYSAIVVFIIVTLKFISKKMTQLK